MRRPLARTLTVFFAAVILTTAIGFVDFFTGYKLSVSLLYLVPVLFVSWSSGRKAGMLMAAIGMLAWFLADASLRKEGFSNPVA